MKNKFKVGDRVQFKTWEEMEKEFGVDCFGDIRNGFVTTMKHLCGTHATIKRFKENGDVELNHFSSKGDTFWGYSTDMIKPVTSEPKWTFTEDEKVILRNMREECKYITRDKNNDLYLYKNKPIKNEGVNVWQNFSSFCERLTFYNHLFRSIKWEDEEPCEFRKYI